MTSPILLNAQSVAAMLGISLRQLEKLIVAGNAPTFIRIGRSRKWRADDVEQWVNGQFDRQAHQSSAPQPKG
ncbi:helix-turn-helix transcriptional regulator [Jeongeupia naejangsanensis]|uniref:Helix-turn-helix domain-containing protein n=1 Tax=Jeongeupia naejangsanensis TaxID=613195 RepID=A0ABS2BLB8_9NEIS|nr:helix-turn-helix domain-containing protein [Jeongeupia naejangsanensis]